MIRKEIEKVCAFILADCGLGSKEATGEGLGLRPSAKRARQAPSPLKAEGFASRDGVTGAAAFLAKAEPIDQKIDSEKSRSAGPGHPAGFAACS